MSTALDVPRKIFAVYMCQMWALHDAIKRQFYAYICSYSTKIILQMYNIVQAYLR